MEEFWDEFKKQWTSGMHPGEEVTIAAMNLNKNKIMRAASKYTKSISSKYTARLSKY